MVETTALHRFTQTEKEQLFFNFSLQCKFLICFKEQGLKVKLKGFLPSASNKENSLYHSYGLQ